MTDLAWPLLGAAGLVAAADWLAVARRLRRLEHLAKPLVMVMLVAVAIVLEPRSELQRWAFVAALALSLVGDVLLMLDRFVPGLVAFFFAHVAYIVGLRSGRTDVVPLLVSSFIVLVGVGFVGQRILRAVRLMEPEMGPAVSAYIAVIAVMGASALASGLPLAATGAALFMASDTLIAWNRFVRPLPWASVVIMVTYHLAQGALVASLAL